MSGVDYETQLLTLVYYVTNRICIKLKCDTKSLYVSNDFAFQTVMIVMILTVLIVADFVKAVTTTFDL